MHDYEQTIRYHNSHLPIADSRDSAFGCNDSYYSSIYSTTRYQLRNSGGREGGRGDEAYESLTYYTITRERERRLKLTKLQTRCVS